MIFEFTYFTVLSFGNIFVLTSGYTLDNPREWKFITVSQQDLLRMIQESEAVVFLKKEAASVGPREDRELFVPKEQTNETEEFERG